MFNKTLESFIKDLQSKGRSTSTITAYRKDISQLNQFLENASIADYKSASLTDLKDFLDKFEKEGYTQKSISRKINSLKTFYSFLMGKNIILDNIAAGVAHPKITLKPPRYLKVTEYRALRDVTRSDVRLHAIVELLLQTGIRIGELARIRIKDLKFTKEGSGNINIPSFEKEPQREVPFNQPAQEAIQRYLKKRKKESAKTDVVFITKTGRPFLIRNIRTAINNAFRRAGVRGTTVNDLRHTYAAVQIKNGLPIKKLYKLLGHKRSSTTERYLEYIKPEREEEAEGAVEL